MFFYQCFFIHLFLYYSAGVTLTQTDYFAFENGVEIEVCAQLIPAEVGNAIPPNLQARTTVTELLGSTNFPVTIRTVDNDATNTAECELVH